MKRLLFITMLGLTAFMLSGCGGVNNNSPQTQAAQSESTESVETTSDASETTVQPNSDAPEAATQPADTASLADGVYTAVFDTDSSMFRVNEANDGRGTLTVENGQMTIHVSLVSKKILNLFPGTAEAANSPGAELLQPSTDTVTYSDGTSEEVFGFDIPVPYLYEEFDCALVGEKGKWYDHKVKVKDPESLEGQSEEKAAQGAAVSLENGTYSVDVVLEGGSGKASVDSPAILTVEDGNAVARIRWSSPHYDYMIVEGEKYLPVNTDGNSEFEIPVSVYNEEIEVQADTVAMSQPHLIDYTLTFDFSSIR